MSSVTYVYDVSIPCDTRAMKAAIKSEFHTRLRQERVRRGITQQVVATACGVSRNAVSNWESGENAPTLDKIEPITEILDTDPVWLLRGKASAISAKQQTGPYATVQVTEYHTRLSAGGGSFISEENKKEIWNFSRHYLADELHLPLNKLAILEVNGDSMEPTLRSGDRVMINMADKRLSQAGLFVMFDFDGPSVKRLELIAGTKPQMINVISDNLTLHKPHPMLAADIQIVGRVVWVARRM